MDLLFTFVLIVHVAVAIGIIVLVLLQHGKGADVGASFGSGASGSLFGATGSANFLSRATAALATAFFLSSLGLTWWASHRGTSGVSSGVMSNIKDAPADPGKLGAKAEPKPGEAVPTDGKVSDIPSAAGAPAPAKAETPAPAKAEAAKSEGSSKGTDVPK